MAMDRHEHVEDPATRSIHCIIETAKGTEHKTFKMLDSGVWVVDLRAPKGKRLIAERSVGNG